MNCTVFLYPIFLLISPILILLYPIPLPVFLYPIFSIPVFLPIRQLSGVNAIAFHVMMTHPLPPCGACAPPPPGNRSQLRSLRNPVKEPRTPPSPRQTGQVGSGHSNQPARECPKIGNFRHLPIYPSVFLRFLPSSFSPSLTLHIPPSPFISSPPHSSLRSMYISTPPQKVNLA